MVTLRLYSLQILGPGLTATICVDNVLSPGAMMEFTRQDGQRERVPVATFRRSICSQFFADDMGGFDGDDPVYLFKQTLPRFQHLDSWGVMYVAAAPRPGPARPPLSDPAPRALKPSAAYLCPVLRDFWRHACSPGEQVVACGSAADPSTGYVYSRGYYVISGETEWAVSSEFGVGDSESQSSLRRSLAMAMRFPSLRCVHLAPPFSGSSAVVTAVPSVTGVPVVLEGER